MTGGLSETEAVLAAKKFESAGADVIDISAGLGSYVLPDTRPGYLDVIAKPIFPEVNAPVILTGGIKTGQDVVDVLKRGVCDLVGVGRAILNDSEWLSKEIRPLL